MMTVVDRLNEFETAGGSFGKFGAAIITSSIPCFSETLAGSNIKSGALISSDLSAATAGDVLFADPPSSNAMFEANESLLSFNSVLSFDSIVGAFSSFFVL
jgi:hypothetical protein